jgi:hypothetical protein
MWDTERFPMYLAIEKAQRDGARKIILSLCDDHHQGGILIDVTNPLTSGVSVYNSLGADHPSSAYASNAIHAVLSSFV